MIILIITTLSCSNQNSNLTKSYPYKSSETELLLLKIINSYRDSIGVGKVVIVEHVSYVSSEHVKYMIRIGKPTHDGFVSRAENIKEVCDATIVGEILAYNFDTNESVMKGWINSDRHDTIAKGIFKRIGISIKEDPEGKKYYSVMFID